MYVQSFVKMTEVKLLLRLEILGNKHSFSDCGDFIPTKLGYPANFLFLDITGLEFLRFIFPTLMILLGNLPVQLNVLGQLLGFVGSGMYAYCKLKGK